MKLSQIVATVSLVIASGCFVNAYAAEHGSIDKVLGSASVGTNEHYDDISLVNGSVKMASNSSAKSVSTVNGSIELRDNVKLHSASTVNGSIESGSGLQVADELSTVNGKILAGSNAIIGGNVTTVNGDIVLDNSNANRDVTTVNGDIKLTGNTVVKGDVVYKPRGKKKAFFGWNNDNKPTLYIGADVVVEGNIILQQEVELQIENPAMQAKVVTQINDGR
ncbi:hypothetical protein [Rheinheimera sp. EpRS3]|uniref:hypothetical protein n=1 Tax=Rheinheimera sp. EpRS3 TaxID=1712383 RepID=UPI0007490D21|nr:hypothetical protein [Rheinheimera sp. EpRS3]KUM51882.1 hypothetical protein AR688_00765 [Rheinheimera sp. EpRS3]